MFHCLSKHFLTNIDWIMIDEDLVNKEDISEASVFSCLKARFYEDKVYVYYVVFI